MCDRYCVGGDVGLVHRWRIKAPHSTNVTLMSVSPPASITMVDHSRPASHIDNLFMVDTFDVERKHGIDPSVGGREVEVV